jgi:hypothetical protein
MRKQLGTVGLASMVAAVGTGCGGAGPGPFAWPKDAGSTLVSLPVKPGQLGVTTLHFDSHETLKQPVVLLGVRPEDAKEAQGVTIRYAASTAPLALQIGAERGWRKGWRLHPVAGFVIPPHTQAVVVVGATASKQGVYTLHGFVVDYRIGGKHYSAPQQIGLQVCVSRDCPD